MDRCILLVELLLEDYLLATRYFETPLERVPRTPRGMYERAPEAVTDAVASLLEAPVRVEAPSTDDAPVQRICVVGKARYVGEVLLAFSALHHDMRPVCKAEVTLSPRWLATALARR